MIEVFIRACDFVPILLDWLGDVALGDRWSTLTDTGYDISNILFVTVPSALASQMLAAQLSSQQQNMYVFCFLSLHTLSPNLSSSNPASTLVLSNFHYGAKIVEINSKIFNIH